MNKKLILAFGVLIFLVLGVYFIYLISFVSSISAPISVHFENNASPYIDEGNFSINWTAGVGGENASNYAIYIFRDGINAVVPGDPGYTFGYIFNNSRTGYSFNTTIEGNYTFIVAAMNNTVSNPAGVLNSANSSNISMVVDRTKPMIQSLYLLPFTYSGGYLIRYSNNTVMKNTDNLSFSIFVEDSYFNNPFALDSKCVVNINGGVNLTTPVGGGLVIPSSFSTCNFTDINLAGLSDGLYPINIFVNDVAGNVRLNNSAYVQINSTASNTTTSNTTNSTVSNNCYQETANVATACGGLGTGAYALTGNWAYSGGARTYDGNWGTYDVVGDSNYAILYINYTKPANALSSSLWQVSDAGITPVNLTITSSCWNYNPNILSLRMISPPTNPGGASQCWNGNSWETLRNYTSGTPGNGIFEEAMWWNPVATNSGGSTSSGSSGSSGGGGGGGSAITTVSQSGGGSIAANHPITLNVTNSSTGVTQVQITSNQDSSNTSVTVSQSNSVDVTTFAKTYQTFQINLGGLDEISVINVSIAFKVNKSWIGTNNRDPANVTLYRNTGTDSSPIWTALSTSLTNQDSVSYYYSAVSPGFSTYSVVVGASSCITNQYRCLVNDLQQCSQNQTWTTTKTCSNGCNQGSCIGENIISKVFGSSVYYFAIAFVILVIAVVSFIIFKKRKAH